MNGINLIPASRRLAKRRRAHLRYCVAACGAWAVLSLAGVGIAHSCWNDTDPQVSDRLAKLNEEMQRTERGIASTKAELAAAQSTLRANQAIATQPDWSILLALLGRQVGDNVVLKSCRVRPAIGARAPAPVMKADGRRSPARALPEAPGVATAPEPAPFVLEASGMAYDHDAATQFVLRLEKTGLFSRVSLLDTAREPFFDRNAIAFRVECALNQTSPAPEASARDGAATATGLGAGAGAGATARGGD